MASQSVQIGQPQSSGYSYNLGLASLAPSNIAASFSGPGWVTSILVIVASLLVLEQYTYRAKKANLPGSKWTIPVIGKFLDSLYPTMEAYHKTWATPLSVTSVFNIFIVMASSNVLSRKILNSPNHAEPCLTAAAKSILIPENWVFLGGKAHVEYRKSLNVLFTRRALAIYLKVQEDIFRRYFKTWLQTHTEDFQPIHQDVRKLNMEASLRVFCGEYLPAHAQEEIGAQYWQITKAFELVNFPLAVPGTKVWNAIQARKMVMHWFEFCAEESKKNMRNGGTASCLLDEWVKEMIVAEEYNAAKARGETPENKPLMAREYSNHEIGMVILSFLFASQDAMSSGLVYAFQHLADNPEVFAKVRQEQLDVRGGDVEAPLTLELFDQMPYLRAFVKESLRLKPPVLMVPYMAKKPFPLSDGYTAPSGSIVIPSFWNSLHDPEVYEDPNELKPERWLPGGQAEHSNPQNYLVFGSGPHKCIGYDYAIMQMGAVVGTAAVLMDWKHKITPDSEVIKIIPTIFPVDDCLIQFKPADLKA